ncbi:periphilin-1 [Salarias fasciatus]|uniref:Periphilin-1-like n=1 Tax=Salarias fasciatus TaxID=181472 RepID=A0A672JIZ8_SALFA|nr:periphilin-1-like [Salarias fasciatus]
MAYRRGRKSIRDAYEEHFQQPNSREVTLHRVVNIVDKRGHMPWSGQEYDEGYEDEQWYGGPRHYQDTREYHDEGAYAHSDRQYYEGNQSFGNFRRNSPPQRNEGPYPQPAYSRDDLRHHLSARKSRPNYFRGRGRGSGPPVRPAHDRNAKEDRDDYRSPQSVVIKRGHSPVKREAPAPAASRSASSSNRSASSEREKGHSHQQKQQKHKPSAVARQSSSSSVEESPQTSVASKEQPSASVAEPEEEATASMEPKLTPEEDFKARRSEAIRAKALEIEKHYRQDCETFRTVVKMLVAKEPSLDNLLQTALDENLMELQQRCLDTLRSFVADLDKI